MLGGNSPVIIFHIAKSAKVTTPPTSGAQIPGANEIVSKDWLKNLDHTPIPVYFDDSFTGLFVDSSDKVIDINTDTETLKSGEEPETNQKAIGSTLTVNLEADRNSIGVIVLSSLMDQIYKKVTAKQYSISFMYGSTTIFRGLLDGFQSSQNADNTKVLVRFELTYGKPDPKVKVEQPVVGRTQGPTLQTGGTQ